MENKLKFDKEGKLIIPESIKEDLAFNNFIKDFKGNKNHAKIFCKVNNLMPQINEKFGVEKNDK